MQETPAGAAGREHPRPDRVIVIGRSVVEIWDGDCCRVTLPDGKTVMGAPHDTDEYRQRAWDHGYGGDIFRLCVEHEAGHVLLAELLGLPESPVMRAVAEGHAFTLAHECEEGVVLSLQRLCNQLGVDLLALAERIGSKARIGEGMAIEVPDASRRVPSPDEVEGAKTTAGGWTRETLAGWGVPWPPPKGWRDRLRREWEARGS